MISVKESSVVETEPYSFSVVGAGVVMHYGSGLDPYVRHVQIF
jgi:hypothetical protein